MRHAPVKEKTKLKAMIGGKGFKRPPFQGKLNSPKDSNELRAAGAKEPG
jgi:hypothetical protein